MRELTKRVEETAFFYAIGKAVTLAADFRAVVNELIDELHEDEGYIGDSGRPPKTHASLSALVDEYSEARLHVDNLEFDLQPRVFGWLETAMKFSSSVYDRMLPLPARHFEDAKPGRRWALTSSTDEDATEPPEDAFCLANVTKASGDLFQTITCLRLYQEMGVGNEGIPFPRPEPSDLLRPMELAEHYARVLGVAGAVGGA
ncbi:MAG: hypothetical protein V4542_18475 [Pseudomonadota bacterium]